MNEILETCKELFLTAVGVVVVLFVGFFLIAFGNYLFGVIF